MSRHPNIAWVCVDEAGLVNVATLVEFMRPAEIVDLRKAGRRPQLVDFGAGPVALFEPIPAAARILIPARDA